MVRSYPLVDRRLTVILAARVPSPVNSRADADAPHLPVSPSGAEGVPAAASVATARPDPTTNGQSVCVVRAPLLIPSSPVGAVSGTSKRPTVRRRREGEASQADRNGFNCCRHRRDVDVHTM